MITEKDIVFVDRNLGICALISDDAESFSGWIVRKVKDDWIPLRIATKADRASIDAANKTTTEEQMMDAIAYVLKREFEA